MKVLAIISALISIIGGGYLALMGFKIINPKKNDPDQKEKMIRWHKKFGTFAKIGGIALVIWGIINLIYPETNAFNFEPYKEQVWTEDYKNQFRDQIINSSNFLKTMPIDSANNIANCFVEKYVLKYSYEEFLEQNKMDQEEIMNIVLPMMTECIRKYKIEEDK